MLPLLLVWKAFFLPSIQLTRHPVESSSGVTSFRKLYDMPVPLFFSVLISSLALTTFW